MTMQGYIHWEEGLFLRPHHLQLMQRQAFEQVAAERRFFRSYPWGVVEAVLSRDELANMLVRFERLRAVMPSGLVVDAPATTNLPPLDIKKAFQAQSAPLTVSLGVPMWYASRGNTIDNGSAADWRVKRLFGVEEVERLDENTGENPQPIRMRRINARLLLGGDDKTDLEVLPLLRILHGEGEELGVPRQDAAFAPPCLVLHGSPVLTRLARDLANAVEASRRELLDQLTRGGFSVETLRGMQLEQMLRLQSLSRFAARLPSMVDAAGVTPFDMYLELRTLLAELAALHPDRDTSQVPDYDHDAPHPAFAELSTRIRALLRGAVAPSFIKAEFTRERGMFALALADEHLNRPNEYYLGIRTKDDPLALARLVEDADKFKLMAASLTDRAIRGIRLVEERNPPLQLPAAVDLRYFRLMRAENARMWERITTERSMTAKWPGCEVADMTLTLYMPVVDGGAGA
jgi:type VI secretion system protein ImpJ